MSLLETIESDLVYCLMMTPNWNEVGLWGLNNRLRYRIIVNGVDISQLDLEDLWSHIIIIHRNLFCSPE